MNRLFDLCVDLLFWLSHLTGLSYKEINIWLFVIIHPIITLYFIYLYRKYKNLYQRKDIM